MKTNTLPLLLIPLIACSIALPTSHAVSPPPDGGYPGGNTAEGQNALLNLSTGTYNTAVGVFSLMSDTAGSLSTAIGAGALLSNNAAQNTATGAGTLLANTTGSSNTALGAFALFSNTSGTGNIGLGANAGINLTTGGNNIDIGNVGIAGESSTIRIGDVAIQKAIFLAGISAMTPAAPNQAVLVDPVSGQLGSADIASFGVVSTSPENTAVGDQALASNTGGFNTATGFQALFSNTTANNNTAVGDQALFTNTGGRNNTAVGAGALFSNAGDPNDDSGTFNNAVGANALILNVDGNSNNALGESALFSNVTASGNTAVGDVALGNNDSSGLGQAAANTGIGAGALFSNVDGNSNNAVGFDALGGLTDGFGNNALGVEAGATLVTGNGNVYIGDAVEGESSESNHTYIRNIDSTAVNGSGVTVDLATGLLGHVSSSRRYKEEVKPMDNASETLYRLKPVTYRFKKEIDRSQSLEYGLVAEDVADVDPNLAIRNAKGQIESVRYEAVNAMLLNEFLKEHQKVQRLEAALAVMNERLKAQDTKIERVNKKVELTKSAPQTALTNQ